MSDPFIPVARPWMDEHETEAAMRPILSGWVTQGPEVASFERAFAEYVGARHACAVSSCTAALHLALLAVGVRSRNEVVTVSHSFIATANSVRHCGAVPFFVDIERDTFNLNTRLIESVIHERTRAILCVHQLGMPCDLEAVLAIARKRGIPVVEDAACAAGSEIRWDGAWEKIGKPHGDIACFSFHPRKLMTTGDGGMLTTSNADFDRQFRLWRHNGMSAPDLVRHRSSEIVFEEYPILGFNYRMTDIQAAVGQEQLKRLPQMVARRREQVARYRTLIESIPGIRLPREPDWARSNWQSFCIELPERCEQKRLMQRMLDRGIATRRAVMCAHREVAYRKGGWSCGAGPGKCGCSPGVCARLPISEYVQDHGIILPLFHDMTAEMQQRVVDALREACIENEKWKMTDDQ